MHAGKSEHNNYYKEQFFLNVNYVIVHIIPVSYYRNTWNSYQHNNYCDVVKCLIEQSDSLRYNFASPSRSIDCWTRWNDL